MLKSLPRFKHRVVRQTGGSPRNVFDIECSSCDYVFYFESAKRLPDEQVAKKMKEQFGWLIGQKFGSDVCPKCLGATPANKLADKFKTFTNGEAVPSRAELADQIQEERSHATQHLLEKHFPMAEQASQKSKQSSSPPVIIQSGISPELTTVLIQTLATLNTTLQDVKAELGEVRAAIELTHDQNSQIISAIAGIVPALSRGNEALANRLEHLGHILNEKAVIPQVTEAQIAPIMDATEAVVETEVQDEPKDCVHAWVSCSQPPSAKGKWCTFIRINTNDAQKVGIEDGTKAIAQRDGNKIVLTADPKGQKVKKQSNSTLYWSAYGLGDTRDFMYSTRAYVVDDHLVVEQV